LAVTRAEPPVFAVSTASRETSFSTSGEWLLKSRERRVANQSIAGLIQKRLNAGVFSARRGVIRSSCLENFFDELQRLAVSE
jgi:hypothetical protein